MISLGVETLSPQVVPPSCSLCNARTFRRLIKYIQTILRWCWKLFRSQLHSWCLNFLCRGLWIECIGMNRNWTLVSHVRWNAISSTWVLYVPLMLRVQQIRQFDLLQLLISIVMVNYQVNAMFITPVPSV